MGIKFGGKKKLIILIGGLFLVYFLLLSAPRSLAYNDQTTHPDLIRETISFYELSTGKKLTDEQKQWIIQGSIDEDKAPRWLNHFYDPAFERGLSTTAAGFGYAGYSAKNWARFSSYQTLNPANIANLWTGNGPVISGSWWGDFSYEAAIKNYSQSKEKEAYVALGNVLHIVGDMTVPEHTRNDAHPGGSFYETWTMNNSAGLTQDLGKRVFNQGRKPVIYGDLGTYFNELANYTNTHFFSPETINSGLYQKPKIIFDDGTFAYGYDENYQLFDLSTAIVEKSLTKSYSINNSQVLQEYWTRLSRQAIVNGAGIISLFVNEAEAAKKVELAKQKVDSSSTGSPQSSFISFISGLFSSSPGDSGPEPAMTIIAGDPQPTAPKITVPAPAVQSPAASPPVPVAPKVNPIAPKTIPVVQTPVVPPPPLSTPTPTYSSGGGGGGTSSSPAEQTTARTFAAGDLIINEIMYNPDGADTTNGKSHEWIEIYNNSASSIDLTGWKINDGDNETNHGLNAPPENGGQGSMTVSVAGYTIITAHAETFLADHAGFTGALIDTANSVSLKNSTSTVKILSPDGAIIDEVTYYNSWGGKDDGKTLERRTASGASSDSANWGASSATGGTPGAANNPIATGTGGPLSGSTQGNVGTGTTGTDVSATTTISQNTTWTLANSPYRLFFDLSNHPTVAAGATLTIEPGVKIIPQSGGATALEIKGTLNAIATSGAPIIFTSKNDTASSTTPAQKGDWLNIVFSAGAQGNLDYVEFRYGGGQDITAPFHEMVDVASSTININNSKFENSKNTALHLMDSSGIVQNSVFSDNNCGISVDSPNGVANVSYGGCYGIHTTGQILSLAGLQIKNNQFIRNQLIGIETRSGTAPTIDSNVFTDNGYPMKIESSYPAITNSQLANTATSTNVVNGIAISGYTHFSQNFTLKKDIPYILQSNGPALAPYVDAGAILTIEPGTVLKTDNTGSVLFVNGSLISKGTLAEPVIFTSLKDVPQAGDWGNIRFNASSTGNFVNTVFNYAGADYIPPARVPPILLADFSAIGLPSWENREATSSSWTAAKNGNFEKIVLHNFSSSNPNGRSFLVGIKEEDATGFIASTTLNNLRDIVTWTDISVSLAGNFLTGKKYYATIQIILPEGTEFSLMDFFNIGKDTNEKAAIAFYEAAEQPYSNPALSIDAAATVVVE
ncbi:lamin tail domain-containing protein [Patescibacteria group bacterium]|nr:lamin tail domain-containing protein [Patescibacteria group bacterium]